MGMSTEGFKLKLGPVLNGILAGLVSITAGCGDVTPFTAIFLGLVGGIIYTASSALQLALKIDDVVDAGPVHFWCGIWGVLGVALFNSDTGTGLADHETSFIGGNIMLIALIIVWVAPTMGIIFF